MQPRRGGSADSAEVPRWSASPRAVFWALNTVGWASFASLVALSYGPFLDTPAALWSQTLKVVLAILLSFVLRAICRALFERSPLAAFVIGIITAVALAIADELLIELVSHWVWGRPRSVQLITVLPGSRIYLVSLCAWCAGYCAVKSLLFMEKQARAIESAKIERQNSEIAAFRFQLPAKSMEELLSGLSSLLSKCEPMTAAESVADFADFLSAILEKREQQFVEVELEIQHVQAFARLQRTVVGRKVDIHLDVPPKVALVQIPRWLLVPLAGIFIEGLPVHTNEHRQLQLIVKDGNSSLDLEMKAGWPAPRRPLDEHKTRINSVEALLQSIYGDGRASINLRDPASIVIRLPRSPVAQL